MTESTKDFLLALALVAFGVATLVVLSRTPNNGAHVADVVDFATLPRLYGLLLVALSALLAGNALVRKRREARETVAASRPPPSTGVLVRFLGTVALTALYVLGLERFEFFPVTAAFLAATFLLYGRRPLWGVALAALLGAAVLDVVFVRIINLPLH